MSRRAGSGIKAMQGKLGLLAIDFYSLIIAVDRKYASDTKNLFLGIFSAHLNWPLQNYQVHKDILMVIHMDCQECAWG